MSDSPPPISLLMPLYNREQFVGASVGSILAQTRRDFELVIYDDASTDGSVAAAERAAGGDPRVRIVRGEHGGVARTTNAAAALLGGKYLGWVDSDDAIAPTALEETVAFLDSHPQIGVVYTDYHTMNEQGQVGQKGKRTAIPYSKDRLLIDFMTFHFRLMRKELFHQVGGMDESMEAAPDYDLCLKLSEITEFHHLERPLYFYRVHKKSISVGNRLKQIEMSRQAIERALVRRGMDKTHEIDVELVGRFRLLRKDAGPNPP